MRFSSTRFWWFIYTIIFPPIILNYSTVVCVCWERLTNPLFVRNRTVSLLHCPNWRTIWFQQVAVLCCLLMFFRMSVFFPILKFLPYVGSVWRFNHYVVPGHWLIYIYIYIYIYISESYDELFIRTRSRSVCMFVILNWCILSVVL